MAAVALLANILLKSNYPLKAVTQIDYNLPIPKPVLTSFTCDKTNHY